MTSAALVSFRLGRADGVSVVAKRWQEALTDLGFDVSTVAGDGPVDRLVPGLAIDAAVEPLVAEVKEALDGFDLVVVENLLTIPMNLAASRVVAEVLRGRPAILHHHDPPWQRPRFEAITELPPDDPSWRHVVINQRTRRELRERLGIEAAYIANAFDVDAPLGNRDWARAALDVADGERLLLPSGARDRAEGRARRAPTRRGRRRDLLAFGSRGGGLRPDTRSTACVDDRTCAPATSRRCHAPWGRVCGV